MFTLTLNRSLLASFSVFFFMTVLPFGQLVAKNRESEKPSAWESALKVLKSEGADPKTSESAFAALLNTDLLALNRVELETIGKAWEARPEAKLNPKDPVTKKIKNEFFHKEINDLNVATFNEVTQSLAGEKKAKVDRQSLAELILAKVLANPVANLEATQSYDQTGQLGFCFGRALLVHYLLLEAGVSPADIAKLFIAGDLKVGPRIWKFHVAVLVKDLKHGYLVIDPLYAKPMTLNEWKDVTAAYDIKGRLSRARFYVTDPRKFLPASGAYSTELFENEHLKKYFSDLASTLKKN